MSIAVVARRIARGGVCAGMFVGLIGCAEVPSDEGVEAEADTHEEVAVTEQAIRNGTTGGGSGQVEIRIKNPAGGWNGCTGSMVSKFGVLTAAHCFDNALGNSLSGTVQAEINFTRDGTNWVCITNQQNIWSDGKCNGWDTFTVTRLQKGWDEKNDLAFIRSNIAWWGVGPADSVAIYYMNNNPANGERVVSWGSGYFHYNGTGDGVMRWMNESITSFQGNYYIMTADDIRICEGDSGGADILTRNGEKYVIGVHSNAELSSHCAKVGGKQRSTNVNAFGSWIRARIKEANRNQEACTGRNSGLHCWTN